MPYLKAVMNVRRDHAEIPDRKPATMFTRLLSAILRTATSG